MGIFRFCRGIFGQGGAYTLPKRLGGMTMAQLDPITCFRGAHPEQGSLRVQVTAAQGIFPIPGASVEVYRDFGAVRELSLIHI